MFREGRAWSMVRVALTVVAVALTITLGAAAARAGPWIQVACVNPDGSAAPSEGWSTQGDALSPGASASAACGPGSPMEASLPGSPVASTSGEDFDSELLVYTPPPGSALLGGTFSLGLSADGSGAGSGPVLTAGLSMQGTGDHANDLEGV